jgi:hypothetical protein
MAQPGVTFFPHRVSVLTVEIKQLQPSPFWEGKIYDFEVAAIDRLKLLESKNASVEIKRFMDIYAVDCNVVDLPNDQFIFSMDGRKSSFFANLTYAYL